MAQNESESSWELGEVHTIGGHKQPPLGEVSGRMRDYTVQVLEELRTPGRYLSSVAYRWVAGLLTTEQIKQRSDEAHGTTEPPVIRVTGRLGEKRAAGPLGRRR